MLLPTPLCTAESPPVPVADDTHVVTIPLVMSQSGPRSEPPVQWFPYISAPSRGITRHPVRSFIWTKSYSKETIDGNIHRNKSLATVK